jgi:galactokinase
MSTVITAVRGGGRVELESDQVPGVVAFDFPVADPRHVEPAWGRYVAGVAAEMAATEGIVGTVSSDLPVGSGLSSSAALEVAVALALGDDGTPSELARRCQLAEQRATGVPCGIMDQLAIAAGIADHALMIDCATLETTPVPIPADARFWVVHSGQERRLAGSAYADRRAECERAAAIVGPLPLATSSAIEALEDPVQRARARHVRSECERVRRFADALGDVDLPAAGRLMVQSHASLRDDFEVSTARLDELVDELCAIEGVHGARLTGAGFGGCVVALADPGVELQGWQVRAVDGARVESID